MENKNSSRQKQGQLSSLAYMTNRYIARTGRAFCAPTLETLARGAVFGLLALTIAPFVLTTPVHATDDNTVSIAVDQNAALNPSGNLYKATTNVTVKTDKPYGFNLVMQTATRSSDLINSNNSTRHIYGVNYYNMATELSANQWGYALNKQANKFIRVPSHNDTPAVIADVTKDKPAGCTNTVNCTKQVTFAANIDPAKLASGSYSTAITYTATAKPAPKPVDWTNRTAKANPSETCQAGNVNSSCLVALDPNMIPVKYTGSTTNAQWTSVANPEAANSGWYDYANKQWANAVTVKDPGKYKNQTRVVDQSDILGFWVYIPRYRYKVLRYSTSDSPAPAQNFTIEFENKQSTKAIPTANGTWATHPAFTFGTKELNGIWFAKFETTGTTAQPTVLPNEAHISGLYSGMDNYIGNFYSLSKTLGVNDPNNVGGNGFTTTQNNHHLAKLSSHMVNNNDWGAATYLSASKYGAGYNGVQINANGEKHTTNGEAYGTTGCGPRANGDTSSYGNNTGKYVHTIHADEIGGAIGTQSACYSGDIQRAYNGTLGQLASTTNNPTGVYDMSGGSEEYVAASYSDNLNNSESYHFGLAAHPPYVNTYNFSDPNSCTFTICGGQALYETNDGRNDFSAQWGSSEMRFVLSSYPWFERGGYYYFNSNHGLFFAVASHGLGYSDEAFRVALAPTV